MGGSHIVAYLVTAALGYWVLTIAGKEQGPNKTIGKVIGWLIIIVSVFGILCAGACRVFESCGPSGMDQSGYACPYTNGGGMACPDMKGMDKGGDAKAAPPESGKKIAK